MLKRRLALLFEALWLGRALLQFVRVTYIFIRPETQQQRIERRKQRDRQTDRQTNKQPINYISQITCQQIDAHYRTLWKHFQQIKRTSNCLIHKISRKNLTHFSYESGQLCMQWLYLTFNFIRNDKMSYWNKSQIMPGFRKPKSLFPLRLRCAISLAHAALCSATYRYITLATRSAAQP